jgi:hypothetical protein
MIFSKKQILFPKGNNRFNGQASGENFNVDKRDYSLKEMMEHLKTLDETSWGRYAFSREPLSGKFDNNEIKRLTYLSCRCGNLYAEKIIKEYKTSDPKEIAEKMDLQIKYSNEPSCLSSILFAEFKSKTITVYMDAVSKGQRLLEGVEIREVMGETLNIVNLLISHEIFHYVEDIYSKEIFTQTERIRLWNKFLIHPQSKIFCLGEIAAMEFAKRLNTVAYSPYIMDVFLVYNYNKSIAFDLYEEIIRLSGG